MKTIEVGIQLTYEVEGEGNVIGYMMTKPIRPQTATVILAPGRRPEVKVEGFQIKKDGTDGATRSVHEFSAHTFMDGGRARWPLWVERIVRHAESVHQASIAVCVGVKP